MEGCPSGLRSTLGKRVCGQLYHEFESRPFRQAIIKIMKNIKSLPHSIPPDLKRELGYKDHSLDLWKDITPIAKNEFICWVISAKKPETRKRRIQRTIDVLHEGKRRPCCWAGCKHRSM